MTSRAVWVLVATVVGCGGRARPARDRVLEQIPASATTLFAADARALAHPRFRPLVDVLRTEIPSGLACVVDAALAGDHVAAGIGPSGEVTIALATRADAPACAALSRIDDRLWIATLGAGAPATAGASVLGADAHGRARPYLREAPVALVTAHDGVRVLATAQPDPLAAWAAFDVADGAAAVRFAGELRRVIAEAAASDAIAPLAKAIAIEHQGSQVVARLGAVDAELAVALRAAVDRATSLVAARAFPCPSRFAPPVTRCEQRACASPVECAVEHNVLEVYSLASALDDILAARTEAVVVNGRVAGVRLRDDLATYGLQRGDMLVAIDGNRVTAVDQVAPALRAARARTSLIVSRSQRFGTIELVEH